MMYDNTQDTVGRAWSTDNTAPNIVNDIPAGTMVFDITGDKVGTVAEYHPQSGYLVVEKGWLFHKDMYVPTTLIARTDADGIYLQVAKGDLQEDQYASPPPMPGTATSTYTADGWQNQGTGVGTTGATYQPSAVSDQTGDLLVPVREEELVAGKTTEEAGRVVIHKDVIEEEQTINVPLRRERVTVERVPSSGDVDPATLDQSAFTEGDIEVPVMRESAVVGKRVAGVETVRVRKDVVTDGQQVSDTVRKERVAVEGVDDQGRAPVDNMVNKQP